MRVRIVWLLAATLLVSSPAVAQRMMVLGAGGSFAAAAPASYSGPGDIVSGATAWYGLRAYTAAIATAGTQKLVAINRSSDSHTCDVIVDTLGGIGNTANCSTGGDNAQTASSFCNATTCQVSKWYDQSGANNCLAAACDLIQAVGGSQPALTFSCLGSLPCVTSSGTKFLTYGATSTSQPLTITAIAIRTATFTSQGNIFSGPNGVIFFPGANKVAQFYGSFPSTAASDSVAHLLAFVANGASSAIYVDNTATAAAAGASAFSGGTAAMFANSIGGSPLTGSIWEAGLWPSAFNSTQAGDMCHNQFVYYATATSC